MEAEREGGWPREEQELEQERGRAWLGGHSGRSLLLAKGVSDRSLLGPGELEHVFAAEGGADLVKVERGCFAGEESELGAGAEDHLDLGVALHRTERTLSGTTDELPTPSDEAEMAFAGMEQQEQQQDHGAPSFEGLAEELSNHSWGHALRAGSLRFSEAQIDADAGEPSAPVPRASLTRASGLGPLEGRADSIPLQPLDETGFETAADDGGRDPRKTKLFASLPSLRFDLPAAESPAEFDEAETKLPSGSPASTSCGLPEPVLAAAAAASATADRVFRSEFHARMAEEFRKAVVPLNMVPMLNPPLGALVDPPAAKICGKRTLDQAGLGYDNSTSSYIRLHRLVSERLELSIKGTRPERDFSGFFPKVLVKAGLSLNDLPQGCKNMKHKFKALYGERRLARQLRGWKRFVEATGTRPENKGVKVPNAVVAESRERILAIIEGWLPAAQFGNELQQVLLSIVSEALREGRSHLGSILDLPRGTCEALVGHMVYIHRLDPDQGRLNRMADLFGDLFSEGEVEMGILVGCTCNECVTDWNLEGVPRLPNSSMDGVSKHEFRRHWMREKAALYAQVLKLHLNYREDMYSFFDANFPKCRNWSRTEVDALLRACHVPSFCKVCKDAKEQRLVRGDGASSPGSDCSAEGGPDEAVALLAAQLEGGLYLEEEEEDRRAELDALEPCFDADLD